MPDTNYITDAVGAFLKAFEAKPDAALRATLIREEANEVIEAAAHLFKELADLAYVVEGFNQLPASDEKNENAAALDANSTVVTALKASMKLMRNIDPNVFRDAFLRVHLANMSKLGDDGKPVRRDDGKIIKGPNYRPPVLDDLVGEI